MGDKISEPDFAAEMGKTENMNDITLCRLAQNRWLEMMKCWMTRKGHRRVQAKEMSGDDASGDDSLFVFCKPDKSKEPHQLPTIVQLTDERAFV